jgi:acetyltransferase-like isoleucine patch superfamily enzyme
MFDIWKRRITSLPLVSACAGWARRLPVFGGTVRRIRGRGNLIECHATATLRRVRFEIEGNDNLVRIGAWCSLNDVVVSVTGNGHRIEIGDGVCFRKSSMLWMQDDQGCLVVGPKTTFESVSLGVSETGSRLDIGADCMFAAGIDVRTGDSHSILEAATGRRTNRARDVSIGDHVWVGERCVILKGCTIPRDCVLAAGAVLTKSIPESGTIAGGNPARPIRTGITWDRSRTL